MISEETYMLLSHYKLVLYARLKVQVWRPVYPASYRPHLQCVEHGSVVKGDTGISKDCLEITQKAGTVKGVQGFPIWRELVVRHWQIHLFFGNLVPSFIFYPSCSQLTKLTWPSPGNFVLKARTKCQPWRQIRCKAPYFSKVSFLVNIKMHYNENF